MQRSKAHLPSPLDSASVVFVCFVFFSSFVSLPIHILSLFRLLSTRPQPPIISTSSVQPPHFLFLFPPHSAPPPTGTNTHYQF